MLNIFFEFLVKSEEILPHKVFQQKKLLKSIRILQIFKFQTNFTIIALVFLKVKLHYCAVPLWKANKMYIFRDTNFFEPHKILVPISPFRLIAFIMKQSLFEKIS